MLLRRVGGKHVVVQHLELTGGREECHCCMCVTVWVRESVAGGQRKSVTVVSVAVGGERRSVTVVCVSLCGLERVWFCGCICEREKSIILVKDYLGVFIYCLFIMHVGHS